MTRRSGAAARGLAATLTLLILVVGLPLVLYRFGGSPLPRRLPTLHQVTAGLLHRDTGTVFLAAVRDVTWGAWALFTVSVLTETVALLRGDRGHLHGLVVRAGPGRGRGGAERRRKGPGRRARRAGVGAPVRVAQRVMPARVARVVHRVAGRGLAS